MDCTICLQNVEHPAFCKACKQLVGCYHCTFDWNQTKPRNQATCPLCRNTLGFEYIYNGRIYEIGYFVRRAFL